MSKVLILRTCTADMLSPSPHAKGFKWPRSGPVSAPDWEPTKECGHGLHGFLWGEGAGSYASWKFDAVWIVAEVDEANLIDIDGGKVKFPSANVVFAGSRFDATNYIAANGGQGKVIIGATVAVGDRQAAVSGYGGTSTSGNYGISTSGDDGTSTSGDGGTSTSGAYGTSTSGESGTSTSGNYGTSTSGNYGTSTSGNDGTSTSCAHGISTSGDGGTSTSGDGGTSTSGDRGTSTSGDDGTSVSDDRGTATSGDRGTSTSGNDGTSISGEGGTVASGARGTLVLKYHDNEAARHRLMTAYVGENGILPNVPYQLDSFGNFVPVTR